VKERERTRDGEVKIESEIESARERERERCLAYCDGGEGKVWGCRKSGDALKQIGKGWGWAKPESRRIPFGSVLGRY